MCIILLNCRSCVMEKEVIGDYWEHDAIAIDA